ncbi:MAG: HDOD domain-containing protein [Rubrivivax sp.]|nr:HDOD domain-containing protein [Rubrivivax sp.]
MGPGAAAQRQLGRFALLRELGRGAQARVWLAHDARLDREVALKLLDPGADAIAVSQWLHEARAVSRLTHPNIVPVFEADEQHGEPYLVFEYVEGPTLAEARRTKPAWPAREAVQLMLGVLDALAAAHEQGIVHRDLKPSNVLLGRDGRPRVMDFGIAARVGKGDGAVVGTPGYMSPEAARGEPPVPAMDVFAAGVMLGELLAGAPLMRESNPYRAVERVQKEDLQLPAPVKVDATLRGIVQRALARDRAARYDGARAMHAALHAWLHPAEGPDTDAGGDDATLQFLLRRMRHKTDFPALSDAVVRIQRVATSETESLKSLTDEILKDVALTNKLLRMVNTAHFTAVAGGGIATVSRAVALVGFAGIRNMALSVLLLEHMGDKSHAAQMKEEFLRALMAGTLAGELTQVSREAEEAFLAAMFQNLGRLLTEYYFPEEALQVRQQIAGGDDTPARREAVSRRVLGIGFADLGAGVARAWGLPDTLQRALRAADDEPPARAVDAADRLRWLGRGANALTEALLSADGAKQDEALQRAAEQHAAALGLQAKDMVGAAQAARTRMSQMTQALGLQLARGAARAGCCSRRCPRGRGRGGRAAAASADAKTVVMAPEPGQVQARLSRGLTELRQAAAGGSLKLNEVLNLVLDTMHGALGFRRVVFCLREARSGQLVGRVGLGEGAAEVQAAFRIAPDAAARGDLFAVLCAKGADLLIADAAKVADRLPAWFRARVDAPTFLVLPLLLKGAPIGLIYADKAEAGSIVLGEQELALLRQLRDQAVAAFGRG